jgi:hypothetical protein
MCSVEEGYGKQTGLNEGLLLNSRGLLASTLVLAVPSDHDGTWKVLPMAFVPQQ